MRLASRSAANELCEWHSIRHCYVTALPSLAPSVSPTGSDQRASPVSRRSPPLQC